VSLPVLAAAPRAPGGVWCLPVVRVRRSGRGHPAREQCRPPCGCAPQHAAHGSVCSAIYQRAENRL